MPNIASFDTLIRVRQRRFYYKLRLTINGRKITSVIIDPHYEKKHSKSINDEIILSLVHQLDGRFFDHDAEKNGYQYFTTDLVFNSKKYRLIWLLEDHEIYVGIINAYRRK